MDVEFINAFWATIKMQDTGCLGLMHWDDPEGWDGEGGGTINIQKDKKEKSIISMLFEDSSLSSSKLRKDCCMTNYHLTDDNPFPDL